MPAATGFSTRSAPAVADTLLLLGLATLWGASYSLIRVAVVTIPPLTLMAARTLIAGLLLLALMRLRKLSMPRGAASWCRFLIQALLNSVLPFTLIAWAEQAIDAGLAAILNSMTSIFAFLLTRALTRHEPTTGLKLAGILAGFAGVALVVGPQALGGIGRDLFAELAVVAATICYAGAAIFGRRFKDLDPMAPAAGSLICGTTILIPLSLVTDRPWSLEPSPSSIAALLALSLCSTALAFVIYFRLIRSLGSVGTTAQGYLRAPIGVAIGVIFLGEPVSWSSGLGPVLILAGTLAMTARPGTVGCREPVAATSAGEVKP